MKIQVQIRHELKGFDRQFRLQVAFATEARSVVLYGPSGAGKSLTMKAIAGLLNPEHGRIQVGDCVYFDSRTGLNFSPQKRRIGYLFQDYALFPHLSVAQNVAFSLAKGLRSPGKEDCQRIQPWLESMRIADLANSQPAQLSGGQRQRVALARALAAAPDLLLLDEPFSAMDHGLRAKIRMELRDLITASGAPLFMISHDPEDLAAFGDERLEIENGNILRSPQDVEVLQEDWPPT